jgi:hypothetical protein
LIVLFIVGEEHMFWSSSLRIFLQPPVISSFLGQMILLSTLLYNNYKNKFHLSHKFMKWCVCFSVGKLTIKMTVKAL